MIYCFLRFITYEYNWYIKTVREVSNISRQIESQGINRNRPMFPGDIFKYMFYKWSIKSEIQQKLIPSNMTLLYY